MFREFEREPDRTNKEVLNIVKKEIDERKLNSSLRISEIISLILYINVKINSFGNSNDYEMKNEIKSNIILILKYLIYNYYSYYYNIYNKKLGFYYNISNIYDIILNDYYYDASIKNENYRLFIPLSKFDKSFSNKLNDDKYKSCIIATYINRLNKEKKQIYIQC